MVCLLLAYKPLFESVMAYLWLNYWEQFSEACTTIQQLSHKSIRMRVLSVWWWPSPSMCYSTIGYVLFPVQNQAVGSTYADFGSIGSTPIYFNAININVWKFQIIHLGVSSGKYRHIFSGVNVFFFASDVYQGNKREIWALFTMYSYRFANPSKDVLSCWFKYVIQLLCHVQLYCTIIQMIVKEHRNRTKDQGHFY